LARAQEYPTHGALHGAGARPLQELLALIWRPAAGAVLPPVRHLEVAVPFLNMLPAINPA
jgi:hypothetical protein